MRDQPTPTVSRDLSEWLRESVRSGLLFGRYDEPLDDAGKRVVRAILAEIDHAAMCQHAQPGESVALAVIATALDNAIKNGCAEELSKMSAEQIAYDLAQLDAGCGRMPIEVIKSGVRAWLSPQQDEDGEEDIRTALEDLNLHCTDHAPDPDCDGCRVQLRGMKFVGGER